MRGRAFCYLLVMAVLLLGASHSNRAEETNWGKWGADDQIGTWNYVTPEVIRHALTLVRKGEVYLLAQPLGPDTVTASIRDGRIYHYMASTGQVTSPEPAFAEDELYLPVHGPTHWDGLGHIFGERKLYNGYDTDTYITDKGVLRDGVQNVSNKMVTRGVLIDLPRDQGVTRLSERHLVTVEDIETAARHEGVSFLPGDAILVRTGWMSTFLEQGESASLSKREKGHIAGSPGIGWDVSQWLKKNRASAYGSDTENEEIEPCEPKAQQMVHQPKWWMPIHYELIRNQGMMLEDLSYLEELAEACAWDHVYEFLFIGGALNIMNGTGSPACPLAIK